MNRGTRDEVVAIINSRFVAIEASFSEGLRGELSMAIDLAGLTGAIDIPKQRSYTERLNRIIERAHQQWLEVNGRVA
ncbi:MULTISPECIES: hypothetical protein [Pseudomonas]|uniref:Uncharacterized protein n=1 Tax=Pseudomonas taiwanensis SJ9 TaxID=1388762 RepID=V7DDN4_9PSED|nr:MULTISPECIES: hypothetical protein [Pseudomonas]ESW39336.1 hypothetical protein O164_12795 [Pseudomonas taiwanensis SJ9]MBZ3666602.1 hypothetical protein [Pseudomonas monteilii]MBZ3671927.1 hypothetical protein [Pseudomonas monteilii]MDD2077453.1 hypothetical protein [Pseudomonas putida]PZQ37628.1 MAG: hypothetical protein DI560_20540 [Pseudomonas putida]